MVVAAPLPHPPATPPLAASTAPSTDFHHDGVLGLFEGYPVDGVGTKGGLGLFLQTLREHNRRWVVRIYKRKALVSHVPANAHVHARCTRRRFSLNTECAVWAFAG
jgi:hypothetical protein